LQRRVTLSQADQIHDAKETIAELEKMLAEAVAAPGNGAWVFRPKKNFALNLVYESNTAILSIYE
jgi:hypothetical protein